MHSTRPYVIHDHKAYCAECGRTRLARIVGSNYLCCPRCDVGHEVQVAAVTVSIVGRELLCTRCKISALVPSRHDTGAECPLCDAPPWERPTIAAPQVVQDVLPGTETSALVGRSQGEGDRPAAPAQRVRDCTSCNQQTWFDPEWRGDRWVLVCRGCQVKLQTARAKVARSGRRKGVTS